MSKFVKILLITATSLILLGAVLFVASAASVGWDFKKLSTEKYVTNTYDFTEDFTNVSIDTDTADLVFVPSEDENCKVVCYERTKALHSVTVLDGVLTVKVKDKQKWYDHIGINFASPKITVYLPAGEYSSLIVKESTGDIDIAKEFTFQNINLSLSTGDVTCYASATEAMKIKASTGDIHVKNSSVASIDISVSTGDISLTDISCNDLTLNSGTGDISLKNVIATGKFSIETNTGDVTFKASDATEISVKTDTGDVEGSFLSDKVFFVKTDTGDKKFPTSVEGSDRCEIETNTGDISIKIEK